MKRVVLLTLVALPLFLCACNTVEGLGEDIQSAGKTIERAGAENK